MDDELEGLRRATEAAPHDADAAQRYAAALLRAGRGDEVAARALARLDCTARWEDLPGDARVRACARCARPVTRVESQAELCALLRVGACVAVPSELLTAEQVTPELAALLVAPPPDTCLVRAPGESVPEPRVAPTREPGPKGIAIPPPPPPSPPTLWQRLARWLGR